MLDRSIALDPTIPEAHILRAQVYSDQRRVPDELRELEAAKALGTTDPWLQLAYAIYYKDVDQRFEAYRMYREVEDRGPGTTDSERNAFCQALIELNLWRIGDEDMAEKRRSLAARALRARSPKDGLTPMRWAEIFIGSGMFDDGIAYGREALKTFDFDGARKTLATALYAKAAEQISAGKAETDPEVRVLLREARGLQVPRKTLLNYFEEFTPGGKLAPYRSILERIVV